MFWGRVPTGQTLAWSSALHRRHFRRHSRPAGGVAFPAACTLLPSRVTTTQTSSYSGQRIGERFLDIHLVYIPLFLQVGHVSYFFCVAQISPGGLPSLPSPPLLLWLEEQPTDCQPQQPAHRQALGHAPAFSFCVTQTKLSWPPSIGTPRHTCTSCSYASLFQTPVWLLLSSLSRAAADYTQTKNDFMASRESLPVMFIATPKDKTASLWTKRAPSVQVSGSTNASAQKKNTMHATHLID